jgi:peptidoglycan/LPS O-acetylase OafA/YrhL
MKQESVAQKPIYFHNLDGLRFIGSLIIIVFHIEDLKLKLNRPTIPVIRHYNMIGNFDVSLFFVLSGFLITYLLLKEKKENGSINLKAYYARRTLRIWPLYYLILFIGFFVLPHLNIYISNASSANTSGHFWLYFIGCALFLSPLVRSISGLPPSIGPIWSVGVEELFYLCWPLFLGKTKRYLVLLIGLVIFILAVRNGFLVANHFLDLHASLGKLFRVLRVLLIEYRISCMAIGGIGAYLVVFEKKNVLAFLFRKNFQWMIYILTTGLLLFQVGVKPLIVNFSLSNEFYSVLFIIIIMNLAINPESIIRLDFKWMTYLGKVSYGLYLYHPIMRIFSLELTENLFGKEISGWQMNVCLYFFTLLFTIIISILSYEFFEKKFLNLKKRFSR